MLSPLPVQTPPSSPLTAEAALQLFFFSPLQSSSTASDDDALCRLPRLSRHLPSLLPRLFQRLRRRRLFADVDAAENPFTAVDDEERSDSFAALFAAESDHSLAGADAAATSVDLLARRNAASLILEVVSTASTAVKRLGLEAIGDNAGVALGVARSGDVEDGVPEDLLGECGGERRLDSDRTVEGGGAVGEVDGQQDERSGEGGGCSGEGRGFQPLEATWKKKASRMQASTSTRATAKACRVLRERGEEKGEREISRGG
uniref:Uncharacterized protein n=1 Tax=Ananas comosus var. bracteatus TaxID=296719 RepID=A0A6V7PL81_ANACO|nr:unnamed protein product [Ananas comosus var. bracteatus]